VRDRATYDPGVTSLAARIADRTARVAIIGQGYVGLPVAMRAAEVGYSVVGFDVSADRVEALRSGHSYVEDITDATLAASRDKGYLPTLDPNDLAGFDVAVITVPTPLREGAPDLTYVESAARSLVPHLRPGCLVVLESTTYPGTTTELVAPVLEESDLKVGDDVHLGYSPERIDPGNTVWDFVRTPKVVSGVDERSAQLVEAFYSSLVEQVVPVGSTAEAELVKLLENTFRHVNIALVNELAVFARELGVDIWSAIDAASTKPYGYMRFTPGPGVGGHCLPIDPSYLSWQVKRRLGQSFRFVELANDVNEHMPDHIVTRVITMLNRDARAVKGTKILLLGLAYKAGTADHRESPSIAVAERLAALGADLRACDPHVARAGLARPDLPLVPFDAASLADCDLALLLVDHPEFDPAVIAEHAPLVFDAKGKLRGTPFRGETL
jgi:UDP-N-acetyl-D-glucosamine dehydrogenase